MAMTDRILRIRLKILELSDEDLIIFNRLPAFYLLLNDQVLDERVCWLLAETNLSG